MMKMTSAYANKLLKKLDKEKEFWRARERECYIYRAAVNEEPLIPEYDYEEVSKTLMDLDTKICKIKHAINVNNVNNKIPVGNEMMSIDCILVQMAQLNVRKDVLDMMRKHLPKTRVSNMFRSGKDGELEYQYINYDLDQVKADYEKLDSKIVAMQIALDRYNQTYEFEVDID